MKHRLLAAGAISAAALTVMPAAAHARSYELSAQADAVASSYLQVAADYWHQTPACYAGIYVDAADRPTARSPGPTRPAARSTSTATPASAPGCAAPSSSRTAR